MSAFKIIQTKAQCLAALKAHAAKQAEHDAAEIELVKKAIHSWNVPIEDVASILGISVRTAYNRLAGKGPRANVSWRPK